MYLLKIDNRMLPYKDVDTWNLEKENLLLFWKLKPYLKRTRLGFYTLTSNLGYWRKANQIHRWFVENVQDWADDCGSYVVSKEKLKELLDICYQVKDSITLIDNVENTKRIADPAIAKKLLPTYDGFYFGSFDYDQCYAEDINDTIEILEKVLKSVDFNKYSVLYHSSW